MEEGIACQQKILVYFLQGISQIQVLLPLIEKKPLEVIALSEKNIFC